MNIEQKNTLFVISLVLVVLLGVAGATFLLIQEHVSTMIRDDLLRARNVFLQAQSNRFDNLLTVSRSVREEPGLIAATLTGDIATVRSMLDDLYPRPGAAFMAVYLDTGPGGVAGAGDKPHYTSSQVLGSTALTDLVRELAHSEDNAVYGNVLLFDNWLQLMAVPIENPLGGRVGVLVIGNTFDDEDLRQLRQLVYADMAIFSGSTLLFSTIPNLQAHLHRLSVMSSKRDLVSFEIDGDRYSGRILPVKHMMDDEEKVAKVLLTASHSRYWQPYRELGESALYFSVLILMIAALFGIWISRRMLTRPVRLLAVATRAIAQGDLNQKVPVKRNDEFGQLTQSFNAMLDSLNASRSDLLSSRHRFRDFAASSSDWLWETDAAGRFIFVSSSVSRILGIPPEHWTGKTLTEVFPQASINELARLLSSGKVDAQGFKEIELWVTTADAGQRCLRMNGVPVIADKRFNGYRGTARDISKSKSDEKRMVILANQDHLTGLSNRRRFIEDLNYEIRRVERHGQLGVLLLIDLDHLKLVNDTAGHAAGDQIIVQVAGLLKRASRDQDLLARISGDEFALAFAAMNQKQGTDKARQLLELISELKPRYGGRALNISASIGVVTFPADGKVPVELLAKADAAMGVAKTSGRNRVHMYNECDMMRERMDNQLVWKDHLLNAMDRGDLVLVYQPIVSVRGGNTHHYEVLVRLRAQGGGLISPGKFIPAAEQFGLIQRLDREVLTRAIRCLADLPLNQRDIGFSINLSGLSIGDKALYPLIEQEVRQAGIDPGRITFEVTETAACEQLNSAVEFIQKIRQLGCRVSLDDFGVGFSSFSYLKHLRADILKIDGSFIRDIHSNNADQLFVKALVDVARGMGMQTIAEFVENEQVYDRVSSLGVDYVQGYYLGKPQLELQAAKNVAQADIIIRQAPRAVAGPA